MNAYFISGLGADKKAFYKLKLPNGFNPVYLDWITPLSKESLKEYAIRFADAVNDNEEFILIGLSFGGMIASEIARVKPPKKIILLSSISVSDEMPWYFRLAAKARLQKLIPVALYKRATILNHYMGTKNKNDKAMVLSFVKKTDPAFIQWSVNAMLEWRQHERLQNSIHIHGAKDRLLPIRYTKANYKIKDGRHLMVLNRAEDINLILEKVLQEI